MEYVFEIDELTKRYASLTALDEITLSMQPGHMIGLIGRNGSGKTNPHPAPYRPAAADAWHLSDLGLRRCFTGG